MLFRIAKNLIFAAGLLLLCALTAYSFVVEPELLFDNNNIYAVNNGPSSDTVFTIDDYYTITSVQTYHWNSGSGTTTPGQISLSHSDGTIYGPYSAYGTAGFLGVPKAYWNIEPDVTIKPGTYTIVDSNPATWSYNNASNGQGIAKVQGLLADNPDQGSGPVTSMALPTTFEAWRSTLAASSPTASTDPDQAAPLGFGSAANGGSMVSLTAALSPVSELADVYVGVQADVLGPHIYLFTSSNQLALMSQTGLVPWKSDTLGDFSATLGQFPVSALPAGVYNFYFLLTPANRLDIQRGWMTSLQLSSEDPVGGDDNAAMEADIRDKLDMITGLGDSVDLTGISQIFADDNVVTTSPADIDLTSLLAGTPITVNADFGSGYTAADGSTWTGSAVLQISNVRFGETSLGGDVTATFNNVTQNGEALANGSFNGGVLLSQAADGISMNISGNLTFNNLVLQGMVQNGSIGISGTLDSLDLGSNSNINGNIVLTMTSFTSGDYTVNNGTVVLTLSGNDTQLAADLETSSGPVDITLLISPGATEDETLIRTASPGTIGLYTVSLNNLSYATDSCGGSATFTDNSGAQIDAFIDANCLGYSLIER